MITAKIFKVKETIQHNGKKYYRVIGYDNRFSYFMGVESFTGAKENETFMEALEQIDTLINHCIVSDKTIHVVFPKKEKPKSKEEKPVDVGR